jgi:hypothetical protein
MRMRRLGAALAAVTLLSGVTAGSAAAATTHSATAGSTAGAVVNHQASSALGWVDIAAYYTYGECAQARNAFPAGYAVCYWAGGTAPWHLAVWSWWRASD